MHEYRLCSTHPPARQPQVLSILAGLTASQPVPVQQQVLVFQQNRHDTANSAQPAKKGQLKLQQAKAQPQYVKLVRDVDASSAYAKGNGDASVEAGVAAAVDGNGDGEGEDGREGGREGVGKWRVRKEGLPDPATKTFISQPVEERDLDADELGDFRPEAERHKHRFIAQYVSRGYRFVHHNIVIHVARLYVFSSKDVSGQNITALIDSLTPPRDGEAGEGKLLDPSGAWLVEVCIRSEDGGNATLRDKAVKELEGFQKVLAGSVDLRCPDRLSLDPRVK